MHRGSFVAAVAALCTAGVLQAQSTASLGVTAGAMRARDAGDARTVDMDLRWSPHRLPWLALMGAAGVSSFGRSALVTDSRDLAPAPTDVYSLGVYSLGATSATAQLGVEVATWRGRWQPYLHALAGASQVTVRGDLLRFYTPSQFESLVLVPHGAPLAPADEVRETRRSARLGAGVRVALGRVLQADLGVRRTFVPATTWVRTLMPSYSSFFDANDPRMPGYDYRRSLSAWGVTVGLRLSR